MMKRADRNLKEIVGIARVGYMGDSKEIEVYVNTDDSGNVPHFYLRDSVDWKKFHSCIKIISPAYFPHEGPEDVLDPSMKKALDVFMRSKVQMARYADKFDNNWQLICFLWELNSADMKIPDDATIPDYRELQ